MYRYIQLFFAKPNYAFFLSLNLMNTGLYWVTTPAPHLSLYFISWKAYCRVKKYPRISCFLGSKIKKRDKTKEPKGKENSSWSKRDLQCTVCLTFHFEKSPSQYIFTFLALWAEHRASSVTSPSQTETGDSGQSRLLGRCRRQTF